MEIEKEVRLGIVGIGNMGSAHAKTVYDGKAEGLRLCAICDVDEKKLSWAAAELPGVKTYLNYKEMLSIGGLDAVLIATPHKLHPVIAIEALEAGLHVLSEKPAGVDIKSVGKLNETANRSDRVFGIMFNQRTNPLFAHLKNMVETGQLGEMKRMVWIITNWYRTQSYYDSGTWRATWSGEGGGVLLNQCPHNLDIWQWIMGMPVSVQASCQYGRYHDIDVEDEAVIYAKYENGASAVFITSTGEYPGTNRLELSGTRGKAVIENGILKWYSMEKDERELCYVLEENTCYEPIKYQEIVPESEGPGHLGILRNFTRSILYGEQLLAPGIEGINALTLSNAAYLSDWLGKEIMLPLDEEEFLKQMKLRQAWEINGKGKKAKEMKHEKQKLGVYSDRWNVRW